MVATKKSPKFSAKKQLKATDTLQLHPPTVQLYPPSSTTLQPETSTSQQQSDTLPAEHVDFVMPIHMDEEEYLEDTFEEQKPVMMIQTPIKQEVPIIRKRRKGAKKEQHSEPKRSLIQVQTTTVCPETTMESFPTAPQIGPQVTSVSTLVEPSNPMMTPPLPLHHMKTELDDCDDGMDMFFQSVKRTIRLTNFSPMEKLDLQMSILQVIREKVFLKNGTH